jgi:hypothetical protein
VVKWKLLILNTLSNQVRNYYSRSLGLGFLLEGHKSMSDLYRVQATVEKDPPRILRKVMTPAEARAISNNIIAEKKGNKIFDVASYWRTTVEKQIKDAAERGNTRTWVFNLKNEENAKRLADYGKSIGWNCSAGKENIVVRWGAPEKELVNKVLVTLVLLVLAVAALVLTRL